jgi:hypothetical protein
VPLQPAPPIRRPLNRTHSRRVCCFQSKILLKHF